MTLIYWVYVYVAVMAVAGAFAAGWCIGRHRLIENMRKRRERHACRE